MDSLTSTPLGSGTQVSDRGGFSRAALALKQQRSHGFMLKNPPPALNKEGFDQEELTEMAKEKLQELKDEAERIEVEASVKELVSYELSSKSKKYSADWFQAQAYLYGLESNRMMLNLWQKYWERVGDLYKPKKKTTGYSDDDVQKARDFPIQDLIGEFRVVSGKYLTKCPFHEDNSPSFVIYPDNSYHCFGCQEHGTNAVDYVMKKNNVDFMEAIKQLI